MCTVREDSACWCVCVRVLMLYPAPMHACMQIIFVVGVQCQRPPLPPPGDAPGCCPAPLAELIQACWADSPADRPPFSAILSTLRDMLGMYGV